MGRDKAFVEVEGVAMVDRVAAALRGAGCATVVAVGGQATALADHGFEVIADEYPGEGPLGGIITAVRDLSARQDVDAVVVASCDIPYLDPSTIRALVAALVPPFVAAVAIPRGARRPSLCAAWSPTAVAPLAAAFVAGERRVRIALSEIPHVMVQVDPAELRNVNAPDDLGQ